MDVLIVDDNEDTTECLAVLLELEGYRVRSAANGEAGLVSLRERFPDVLILDVEMPLLDGPGMAGQMIVEDCGRENIPIVLSSAVTHLPAVAARVGTPYFIAKPCDPRILLALVARAGEERTPPCPTGGPARDGGGTCQQR